MERLNYYYGKVLTARDLISEQKYHIEKRKLHNRYLHGCGVVSGLKISKKDSDLFIAPGLALDCCGNEIIIENHEKVEVEIPENSSFVFVGIKYRECPVEFVPSIFLESCPDTADQQAQFIREGFELTLENDSGFGGHLINHSFWQPCGKEHAIPLGKLLVQKSGWKIDEEFLRPVLK